MAYTGRGASISPTMPLSPEKVPTYPVRCPCLMIALKNLFDSLAADVALARLYWLQKEIGCIAPGRARCNDERPNRERA